LARSRAPWAYRPPTADRRVVTSVIPPDGGRPSSRIRRLALGRRRSEAPGHPPFSISTYPIDASIDGRNARGRIAHRLTDVADSWPALKGGGCPSHAAVARGPGAEHPARRATPRAASDTSGQQGSRARTRSADLASVLDARSRARKSSGGRPSNVRKGTNALRTTARQALTHAEAGRQRASNQPATRSQSGSLSSNRRRHRGLHGRGPVRRTCSAPRPRPPQRSGPGAIASKHRQRVGVRIAARPESGLKRWVRQR
jgi:hypothetical protein